MRSDVLVLVVAAIVVVAGLAAGGWWWHPFTHHKPEAGRRAFQGGPQ